LRYEVRITISEGRSIVNRTSQLLPNKTHLQSE
jgi:hypothetical protein